MFTTKKKTKKKNDDNIDNTLLNTSTTCLIKSGAVMYNVNFSTGKRRSKPYRQQDPHTNTPQPRLCVTELYSKQVDCGSQHFIKNAANTD